MNQVEEVYFPDRASLRSWLTKNHDQEKAIWLVYDKASVGGRKLTYDDIVEEALCFGWIDSTARGLDEKQSMLYLSVRKPKSVWSASNKERVEQLTKANLMQPAGLTAVKIAKENGSWNALDNVDSLVIPTELKQALESDPAAAENFESYSLSVKKQILYRIYDAKAAETRQRRVDQLMASIKIGKNPLV